jgi:hypothetical protein
MTERELDRRAAHRLAVMRHALEVTANVSRTCRYCGITRQARPPCDLDLAQPDSSSA